MAAHSSILASRIPWTEESGGLQSMGSQRVRYNLSDLAHTHTCLLYNPNSVKSGSLLSIGNRQHCGGRRNPNSDPVKIIVPINLVM